MAYGYIHCTNKVQKLPRLVTHHSSKKDMLKEIVHNVQRKGTQVLGVLPAHFHTFTFTPSISHSHFQVLVVLPAHKGPLAPPPILASVVNIILELYFKHIKKSYLKIFSNPLAPPPILASVVILL